MTSTPDLCPQALSGCRVAQVLMQYCVGANYYWLLVEGLYLHNLLVLMVFSENSYFCGYLFIGWGRYTHSHMNTHTRMINNVNAVS